MSEWLLIATPNATGVLAFVGSFAAVRVDLHWIKKELARHDRELARMDRRIDHVEA